MASKADIRRFQRLAEMGCIVCKTKGWFVPAQVHHIVDKGYRRLSGGHESTLPLCPWHHQGQCIDALTQAHMVEHFGPSLALNKRAFVQKFGTERELLVMVNEELSSIEEAHS